MKNAAVLLFVSSMAISAGSQAVVGIQVNGSGTPVYFGGVSETHIDASHTARILLDSLTPGIQLVA